MLNNWETGTSSLKWSNAFIYEYIMFLNFLNITVKIFSCIYLSYLFINVHNEFMQTISEYLFFTPEKAHYISIIQLQVLSREVTNVCS